MSNPTDTVELLTHWEARAIAAEDELTAIRTHEFEELAIRDKEILEARTLAGQQDHENQTLSEQGDELTGKIAELEAEIIALRCALQLPKLNDINPVQSLDHVGVVLVGMRRYLAPHCEGLEQFLIQRAKSVLIVAEDSIRTVKHDIMGRQFNRLPKKNLVCVAQGNASSCAHCDHDDGES